MIVKMKFISITGPKVDIDRVVNTYLTKYEMHLENALSELTKIQNLSPYLEINPYKEDLNVISSYYDQITDPDKIPVKTISLEQALNTVQNFKEKINALDSDQITLTEEKNALQESLKIMSPFRHLDYDMPSILHFHCVHYHFGRIEKTYYEKFKRYIYDDLDTLFYKCEEDDEYVWGIYFAPKTLAHKIDAVYSSMHFEKIFIPDKYHGTGREIYESLTERNNDLLIQLDKHQQERQKLLSRYSTDIKAAKTALEQLSTSFDVRRLAACTSGERDIFYILCGWMSEDDSKRFQEEIKDDPNIFCMIEDIGNDGQRRPPTKLKNPRIFRPFEMYIRMYGLPAYNEFDPTWFVALTYSFIFGTMFGDVGQGLCLFIGGAILYRIKHIALAAIISLAGIFSTLFGFLYGSFFGFEELIPALWLKPREAVITLPFIGSMNTVFVAAIVFGMFTILVTMIFHIINAIRAKDLENILFDQNAAAGLVFYGSLVCVIFLYMTGHKIPAALVLTIMFLVPLLLIMLKEPLTRLVKKKTPAIEGGKAMFFVQSFFELFEVLLTYLSNTLSFIRMGAFAVSHAAMMEVVLMLAGAAEGGSPNWLVIVLGNLFVCAMEGLIVGIQVLRLEYYEMFSRFYKGNGREFHPFIKIKSENHI